MAQIIPAPLSVAVTGTGSSANLIAASAGKSIRIWQLLIGGTAADTSVVITWTVGGVSTTMKCGFATAIPVILPYTGCPWAAADVGTGITFTAASTTIITAFYTKGVGG